MSSTELRFSDLPWLPRAPADLKERLRSIDDSKDWGPDLRKVASHHIDLNLAMLLERTHERLAAKSPSPSLSRFRLGVVSNATTDFLRPFLICAALRCGVSLEVIAADFDQSVQEAMNPDSRLNRARLDAVLIALDYRGLPFRNTLGSWPAFHERSAIEQVETICRGFRTHSGVMSLVQTIPAPKELLFGSLDVGTPGTLRESVLQFNAHITRFVRESGDVVIDVDWLAQSVGLNTWYDDRQWFLAKMPWSRHVLPIYGDFVARTIGAMRGRSRKCLVLDLDNTIWGGVIGDDGVEGIALEPGDPIGESFRAIQAAALDLKRRGVVLAVCSKNDEAIARIPFREHPAMLLRESDIAVFVANWDDKATNIERIASRLELGLDAMVLLDDNPAEREQVRSALPDVAVPELGSDPSTYPSTLFAAGYFDSIAFTNEDLSRADQYRANSERNGALQGARNLEDFLRSLDMEIEFAPFTAPARKRIAQLINKTNQFNVTTKRYTEVQVAALEGSPNHHCVQMSLRDKFGDNGTIGVVICEIRGCEWHIDSWLMSCRVLNRGVEQATCDHLVRAAQRHGSQAVVGRYVPTARNGMVKDLFERLGFQTAGNDGDASLWKLDVPGYAPKEAFFGASITRD